MHNLRKRCKAILAVVFCLSTAWVHSQCPDFTNESITGNSGVLCEGEEITISLDGENIPNNSTVDFYIGSGSFNPYSGGGDFIGSVDVIQEPCENIPEVLYVMVNPDNAMVGSSDDKCDEFIVIWTGSGGFNTSDIIVSNLSDGSFQWDDFVAGDASGFSCGTSLPPGEVPPNAILIITGAINNNVFIFSDELCDTGLPVYIIANNNTNCSGGWFDNDSPCASCPVQFDIDGDCMFSFNVNYNPPATSTNGWGWSNLSSGVFANMIHEVDVPEYVEPEIEIPDFNWTVPADFCENFPGGNYAITGILDPPPFSCPEIFTPYFPVSIGCSEVSLTGGGDICEGNCPDAPNSITFEVLGNDFPVSLDLEITASAFPPFDINDILVVDGQELFICLEGIFPSFDPVTNTLTVPTFAIGITATIEIISATSNSGCPVPIGQNTITVTFIAAPTANAGPDQTICSHEQVILDGTMGGSASNAVWTTSGDGVFADNQDISTTYSPGTVDIDNGTVTLTLSTTDETGACIPATSSLEVTIEESLFIQTTGPGILCNTSVATILAEILGPNVPGMWETTGDGEFLDPNDPSTEYDPGSGDVSFGSVTLFFNPINPDICVQLSEPLFIDIVNAPLVNLPQNIEVCSDEDITIHIDVSGSFIDINWATMGDGTLVIINDTEVNYTPGPQDIANQFTVVSVTVVSAFPECGQTTYNMPIDVILCDCAPFELIPLIEPVCFFDDTIDLATLIEEAPPGSWSITGVPAGSMPATIVNGLFITDQSDYGEYELTYTLSFPEVGCPPSDSLIITVVPYYQPALGADRESCDEDTVLLNVTWSIIVPTDISWQTLGEGTFFEASSLSAKYVPDAGTISTPDTVVFILNDHGCGVLTDTLIINFHESPFAEFVDDTVTICNETEQGSILNFNALVIAGDLNGQWTNMSGAPVNLTDPANVDFSGIPEGYYAFRFETNDAVFPCTDTSYTIIIDVDECDCPLLEIQSLPEGVCNDLDSLNLAAFVMAGAPGFWQVVSTPPGSNPATVTGTSIFQTFNKDPGTYRLRFTFNAAPIIGCPDSAEIGIIIQEIPTVEMSGDTISCWVLDLEMSAAIGGSAIGVLWSTSGLGTYNDNSILNPIYTPAIEDLNSAHVILYATAIDTFGFCTAGYDSIDVMLVHPPTTTWSSLNASICNHPDSNTIVNLFSFITSGDGTGIWSDLDGAGVDLSNSTAVDFDGVPVGTYNFSYTTQTAVVPCVDSVYTFAVVVENCTCPSLQLQNVLLIVCEGENVDLEAELIIEVDPGQWSLSNGPAGQWPQISGNTLNTNGAAVGDYVLIYTLTEPVPGCEFADTVLLIVEERTFIDLSVVICDPVLMNYRVFVESNATSIISDFGDVTDLGGGEFVINNIPIGQDILVEAVTTTQECFSSLIVDAPDCNCTLTVEDITDTIFLCPGDTFILIPEIMNAQGLAFSTWIGNTTFMQPTLPLFEAGQWIWIVRDSLGCETRDTFDVMMRELIEVELTTVSPSCAGISNGLIIIGDVEGGQGPYTIQLDNGTPFQSTNFPDTLENIDVGMHSLTVSNLDGCETIVDVILQSAAEGNLDLGPDQTIFKGDSLLIEPDLEGIVPAIVIWDPVLPGIGAESFWFAPSQTTLLNILITDEAGCEYEDEVLITVLIEQNIFIPTIFSPNGDQFNDVFEVFTSSESQPLESLEIFDRWGNMIHRHTGSGGFTWDGTSKGKELLPGVYIVKVVGKDQQGERVIYTSDLTLIR